MEATTTVDSSCSQSDEQISKRKDLRRIQYNIILLSIGFNLNMSIILGLSYLQSSLHIVQGMGTINSSVLYIAVLISSLFLPKLVIQLLGYKKTIIIGFLGYLGWAAANGYGVWWTMTPASVLLGLCAAPVWTAQSSYFVAQAKRYASLSGEQLSDVLSRFFGVFFFCFSFGTVLGSILNSTLLQAPVSNSTLLSQEVLGHCGIKDCPSNDLPNPNLGKPDSHLVWIMLAVYISLALLGEFILLFLDDIKSTETVKKGDLCQLLLSTMKQLTHRKQLLLVPITVCSGFTRAFISAEFSKSFVACTLGISRVGFATLPWAVSNCIASFLGGRMVKYTGRPAQFLLALVIEASLHITLMLWSPHPDNSYVFYVISGVWGISSSIWKTQTNALYGVLFADNSDAAYSTYRLLEALGFIIAFGYSSFLCTSTKLYVVFALLLVGWTGYATVEYSMRCQTDPTNDKQLDKDSELKIRLNETD